MRRNVIDLRDGLAFSTEPHELLMLVILFGVLLLGLTVVQDGFYPGRRHELLKQRNEGLIRPGAIPIDEAEITEEEFPKVEQKVVIFYNKILY